MSLVRYRTQRLLGADRVRAPRSTGEGLRARGGDLCGSEVIARHRRSYEREDMIFDPLHYLALLEQKTRRWTRRRRWWAGSCPKALPELRRLMEARLNKGGKREYVQVLRLLETFSLAGGRSGYRRCAATGHDLSFDAVKHLLLCRIERRPPRLDLENYPHLPLADVQTTQAADYMVLLSASPLRLPSEVTR